MAIKERFFLFYVYNNDKDDQPYIIRNPPRNIKKLLDQWRELDRKMCAGEDVKWDYVNVWLKKKGVDIIVRKGEIYL